MSMAFSGKIKSKSGSLFKNGFYAGLYKNFIQRSAHSFLYPKSESFLDKMSILKRKVLFGEQNNFLSGMVLKYSSIPGEKDIQYE